MKTDLDVCREELEQVQREYEEFAYLCSHELKAPARAISNIATWLQEDLDGHLPAESKTHLQLLQNRAGRLERMVDALLRLSSIRHSDPEMGVADTTEIVKTIFNSLDATKGKNLVLPSTLPVFYTYKVRLQEVFTLLLDNAGRYSYHPGGEISLSCEETAEFFLFSVKDRGPGVREENLTNIFRLFYTDKAKDNLNTTGAGLAIARAVVQVVRGQIGAQNRKEGGLTVWFTWPVNIKN